MLAKIKSMLKRGNGSVPDAPTIPEPPRVPRKFHIVTPEKVNAVLTLYDACDCGKRLETFLMWDYIRELIPEIRDNEDSTWLMTFPNHLEVMITEDIYNKSIENAKFPGSMKRILRK